MGLIRGPELIPIGFGPLCHRQIMVTRMWRPMTVVTSDPSFKSLTNNAVKEIFDHNSASLTFDWDISDQHAIKYLYAYQNFLYYFDRDNDFSIASYRPIGDTVDESVFSLSHELDFSGQLEIVGPVLHWLYYFQEDRDQLYGLSNRIRIVLTTRRLIPHDPGYAAWFPGCVSIIGGLPVNGAATIGAWWGSRKAAGS